MKLSTALLGSSLLVSGALSAPLEKKGWGDYLQVNFFWNGECTDFAYQYNFINQKGTSWVAYDECKAFDGSYIWSAAIAVTELATSECLLYTDSNCNNPVVYTGKNNNKYAAFLRVNNKNGNGRCIRDDGQHIGSIKCKLHGF